MAGLQLIITKAGRAALVNAEQNGTAPLTIASVGLTQTAFVPDEELTTLPGEFKRLGTISGETVAPDTIHVTIRDDSTDTYNVNGIGYWLSNDVLLAVYGQTEPVLQKSAQSMLLLSADMVLTTINVASLTFGDSQFTNPPATSERQGVVELASLEETTQGTDAVRAVTPAGLSAALIKARLNNTDALPEGKSNLYFTMERVRTTVLNGLSLASNAVISATDTVITAMGKLQQQISELVVRKAEANGANASGNWAINITGTATHAGSASNAITSTSASRLNLNGGGASQFHWQGYVGQPTWCWGGNDAANMYVYNPSNFSVARSATSGYAEGSGVATRAHNGIVSISYGTSGAYREGATTVMFTYLTFVFYNGRNLSIATGNIDQGSWYDPKQAGIPTSVTFY